MYSLTRPAAVAGGLICAVAVVAAQSHVTKESVPGIVNFAHVETTVAVRRRDDAGGAGEVKRMGYASVINLRQASEAWRRH